MRYMTVKELSEKWNVSERRIVAMLGNGQIIGAEKRGKMWVIPENVKKPDDGRFAFSQKPTEKVVVVAGINSDVGVCLARQLISENFVVISLYQKGSEIPSDLLSLKNTQLIEVDYFNRKNLIETCKKIKQDLAGLVYLEIFFKMEDSIEFDYETFEKSFQINLFAPNVLTRELVGKMDANSSIVITSSVEALRGSFGASAYSAAQAAKVNLVQSYSNIFSELYGVRVNTLLTGWIGGYGFDNAFNKTKNKIPLKRLGFPEEVADDIFLLLTRHKYTTGSNLVVDGGYLSVDEQSRSEDMDNARFYRYIFKFIEECKKGDKIWAVSMLMPNEWNDEPQERKFREENINAAVRGVDVERVFVFDISANTELKTNAKLRRYVLNKYVNNYAVDIKTLQNEAPELLKQLDNGFFAINNNKIFVDYLADDGKSRGYLTMNKDIVKDYKKCFDKLKQYAKPISEVLK